MEVIKLTPRGYCHGVVNALVLVKKIIGDSSYPRPIYVLGQIVHNRQITDFFSTYDIISLDIPGKSRLEMLETIDSGTVIFTAHGVSDQVITRAKEKGLTYVNATCSDVTKVHDAVKKKISTGYKVIYIGKKDHPESEAVLELDQNIYFVEKDKDVLLLPKILDNQKIFVTNQTTLSMYDIKSALSLIEARFSNYEFDNEICKATTIRQNAVMNQDNVDLMLVVGDKKSSNSKKLVEVGLKTKAKRAFLIQNVSEINLEWLMNAHTVSVTSGASTPTSVTNEVINFLNQYKNDDPQTWDHQSKLTVKDIL